MGQQALNLVLSKTKNKKTKLKSPKALYILNSLHKILIPDLNRHN